MKSIITLSVLAICLMLVGGGCATSHSVKGEIAVIAIDAIGGVSINGQPTTISDFSQTLEKLEILAGDPIIIRVDNRSSRAHLVGVLNELRTLGYSNVSLATAQ